MRSRGVCLALVLLTSTACTGDGSTAEESRGPAPTRTADVVAVDACALVAHRQMRNALGERVRVVGRRLEAPTLPTETCLWGREFGVALVEVRVTPGPVSAGTFETAFGQRAGGEPTPVDVGDSAYSRGGLTSRTLQVLDHGVVLSLEARDSPGDRLPRQALPDIARAVLERLPANPELADADPPAPCARIDEDAVTAAMGTDVRLRGAHVQRDGAAMCSWAGLPGNVVVTVRTGQVQITNFRANLSPRIYQRVAGVPAEAWSQSNRAGDLLVFLDGALVEVTSLPGAGYSSARVPTTEGELRLARELVRTLAKEGAR